MKDEVRAWMESLGFQDNTKADIPNYVLSLKAFIAPCQVAREVYKHNKDWDPIKDISVISPEVAELFYQATHQ